jgi:Predicted AAA-ATPase/PD-(D/E)XK nuclease superfamily
MQKYPIGIQNFQKLREGGFVYVDKTQHIYNLTQQAGYYFFSRPRRFGKSLLISTLQVLYEGRKALFDGLWIADKWDFEQTNPTIVIYFNQMSLYDAGLAKSLLDTLQEQAVKHQITLESDEISRKFQELIQKLHYKTGRKVVVLIDEYDKPIVDYLEELETAEINRKILKSFYGILKPADEHLEFVLLTGVSKFAKVSIFSDLNNLNDISLDKKYASLVGITQTELETVFSAELEALPIEIGISKESFLAKIKHWYNGYSWDKSTNRLPIRVYNPFSILRFFGTNGDFQNYWFSTGTPTWLVKQLKDKNVYDVKNIIVPEEDLDSFDIHNLQPITLLFQTGYLTIVSYNKEDYLYTLDYPNEEVRMALNQYLLNAFRYDKSGSPLPMVVQLRNALQTNDIATAIEIINTIFSTLPYDLWQRENERFYHALIHLTFTLLGVYVQSEVHTARGRCDVVVHTKDYIYAFEFKLDKTAQAALAQIEDKGYLNPYRNQTDKQLIAVGVNFSTELKAVESWLEKVG